MMLGSVRYNCRVYLLNGCLLLIRPKISLADDGNYRCKIGPHIFYQSFWLSAMLLRFCMRADADMALYRCITAGSPVPRTLEPCCHLDRSQTSDLRCPCRESRYFTTWKRPRQIVDFRLPLEIQELTGEASSPACALTKRVSINACWSSQERQLHAAWARRLAGSLCSP